MKYINILINKYNFSFSDQELIDITQKKISDLNERFQAGGGAYFTAQGDAFLRSERFSQVHIDIYRDKNGRPSLPLLAAHLAGVLGIDKNSTDYEALLLVAFRAEMGQSDPPPAYHNPCHFADVAVMTAVYAQSTPGFTTHDKALALIAAFGHDIDHDGRPNPSDNPAFNEEKSYTAMQPLLEAVGISKEDQQKIHVILLTTSINGPLATLKSIATGKPADLSRFPELKVLISDNKLAEIAAIVTDADIFAGSGAGLAASVLMSKLLTEEMQSRDITLNFNGDGARLFFLENVIGKEGYLSQAARNLSNSGFEKLLNETHQRLDASKTKGPNKTPSF